MSSPTCRSPAGRLHGRHLLGAPRLRHRAPRLWRAARRRGPAHVGRLSALGPLLLRRAPRAVGDAVGCGGGSAAVGAAGVRELTSASGGFPFGVPCHHGSEREAVMKKILSVVLVAMLSLALAVPVSAGRGGGGGFHGGSRGGVRGGFHHGGFHHGGFHHDGFHRFGCCFGPGFVGGVFVGSALAYPYYGYSYAYPYATYPVYRTPCSPRAPPSRLSLPGAHAPR